MDRRGKVALFAALVIAAVLVVSLVTAPPPVRECKDNADNDGDGLTDWPADPGCANKNDQSELDPNVECDDGVDNDGDGNIDSADAGCSGPTDNDETNCGDDVAEGGETCDGTDLAGETCVTQGHDGGTLACNGTCDGFDTSGCFDDTCSDTDGGISFTVQGTVSGDSGGVPYSFTDFCLSGVDIVEYSCLGDAPTNTSLDCTLLNLTSCSNGACV